MAIASPLTPRRPTPPDDDRIWIARWLFACCAMIVAMIVIGAITRLTESGLSIMEWAPVTGALPPTSEAEWQRLFDLYRQTGEYRTVNPDMTVAEFRTIFWWEWIHRLWGRLIGIVYFVPLIVFLVRRRIPEGLTKHLIAGFLLGAAQGALGWFMVSSGFADRTDVSQYRLAAHLALAFGIHLYLFWLALSCIRPPKSRVDPAQRKRLVALMVLIAITATMGAFTAGLDGGLVYNYEFPTMGGTIVPPDAFTGGVADPFENSVTAQLVHRWLAIATVLAVLWTWWRAPHGTERISRKIPLDALAGMALLQALLGIATLMSTVALPVAVLHQGGAVALLTLGLWGIYEARPMRADDGRRVP